jgi:hypothetical protein
MPLRNHAIEREELMAFLDGELAADRAAATVSHLEGCQECQKLAADFRGLSRHLTNWQIEQSSPALANNIMLALEQHASQPRRMFEFFARRRIWAWAGGLGAVALVGAVFIQPRSNPQYQIADRVSALVGRTGAFQIRDSNAGTNLELVRARNPMIVRTAQLTIAVKDFTKTRSAVDEILKRHKGYLGQSNVSSPVDSGPMLEATLRVPSDQLEAVMEELKVLGRVESESQTGEEVTQQYVDLDARLSNARNSERRLTDLLRQQTGRLADVLSVEKEIERVRGEIERMEAENKNLANRVDFATLNVKLFEEYRAGLQMPGSASFRLRNAAVEGYRTTVESVTGAVSFLLAYGPSVLFWSAVLFFPLRLVWRRFRRRLFHSL